MSERTYNPEYSADELGLEMISFDKSSGSYEFDTICFWATEDGRIYTASDSGCSCPTPFERYCGASQEEVLQKLERLGSIDQAMQTFKSWADSYAQTKMTDADFKTLKDWLEKHFKQ